MQIAIHKSKHRKQCYSCGVTKNKGAWRHNGDTGLVLCTRCFNKLYGYERRVKMYARSIFKERICYACGVRKSDMPKNVDGRKQFFANRPTSLHICSDCLHIIIPPAYRRPEFLWISSKRLKYKGRLIAFDHDLRIGVCNMCRAVKGEIDAQRGMLCKQTTLHHHSYDDNNPLSDTLEICSRCHREETAAITKNKRKLVTLLINLLACT